MRHTPPGGVAVMVAGEADAIRIEVRDMGEGIPPDELPRAWERFYRGESARQDGPGAGLGLTLVKELVEAMNGTVGVESVVEQGGCFTAKLYHIPQTNALVLPTRVHFSTGAGSYNIQMEPKSQG